MEPPERARLVLAIEAQFLATLHAVVATATPLQTERDEIASAVLALLLKRMYRQRGGVWIEAVLKMVLMPDPPVSGT